MQLVDELSMIYTACLMCYATFSFSQSRATRQILGLGLASLAIFITVSLAVLQPNSSTDILATALLPLPPRPSLPPKRLRPYYSHRSLPKHVRDGIEHSALPESEICHGTTETY